MIDPKKESPITLDVAASHPAFRRNGRKPHKSSLWRWIAAGATAADGHTRVRLETFHTPYGTCTSAEAIDRFVAALNGRDVEQAAPSTSAGDAAAAELTAAGY